MVVRSKHDRVGMGVWFVSTGSAARRSASVRCPVPRQSRTTERHSHGQWEHASPTTPLRAIFGVLVPTADAAVSANRPMSSSPGRAQREGVNHVDVHVGHGYWKVIVFPRSSSMLDALTDERQQQRLRAAEQEMLAKAARRSHTTRQAHRTPTSTADQSGAQLKDSDGDEADHHQHRYRRPARGRVGGAHGRVITTSGS